VNEDRLTKLLRDHPIPYEQEAEERGWRVARAAFEERDREPAPPPRHRRARLVLALAGVVVAAAALALTPAGARVGDLIDDVIEPGQERAEPALTALPTDGRLLVESAQGPWIVQPDGSKRLLGEYDQATWSPGGLFVAATRGAELTAVVGNPAAVGEPAGTVRWSLAADELLHDPAWAPSGFRIAYMSGDSLRIVAGDGTNDRRLDERVAATAPIWKPGRRHLLTYVDRNSRVRLTNVDSGRQLWASGRYATDIKSLAWSRDGRRLLVLTSSFYTVLDDRGRPIVKGPTRGTADAAAFSPEGPIALIRHTGSKTAAGLSEVVLVDEFGDERRLFSGPGRFADLTWSPDGRWLLFSWQDADQWLFVHPDGGKPDAVSRISRQFNPGDGEDVAFPRVSGWCCRR
jgi:WD40-like Beta Propeller Repeat